MGLRKCCYLIKLVFGFCFFVSGDGDVLISGDVCDVQGLLLIGEEGGGGRVIGWGERGC